MGFVRDTGHTWEQASMAQSRAAQAALSYQTQAFADLCSLNHQAGLLGSIDGQAAAGNLLAAGQQQSILRHRELAIIQESPATMFVRDREQRSLARNTSDFSASSIRTTPNKFNRGVRFISKFERSTPKYKAKEIKRLLGKIGDDMADSVLCEWLDEVKK